jgi:hypothetical protein
MTAAQKMIPTQPAILARDGIIADLFQSPTLLKIVEWEAVAKPAIVQG